MKMLITFFLISLFLLAGCVSPQPEIRYYKSYNKPPDADEFISGNGFKIWVSKDFNKNFTPVKKESQEWQDIQEKMSGESLQFSFYNRDSGVIFMILKNRYRISYDKALHSFKNNPNFTVLESDQRMVNNSPALYVRVFFKKENNNTIASSYYISTDSGTFRFIIMCLEDEYGKYRKMIQDILNGIEVN